MSHLSSSTPDPLLHMCVRYCANNIETLTRSALINTTDEAKTECNTVQNTSGMSAFPTNLSNMIFAYIGRYLRTRNKAEFVQLMSLFGDPNKTPLRRVSLQQEHDLSTSLPQSIFNQPLQYLDLCCCQFYHHYNNTKSVSVFDKMCKSLKVLRLSFDPHCRTSGYHIDKSNDLADPNKDFTQSCGDRDTTNTVPTAGNEEDVTAVKQYKFCALTSFVLNVDENLPKDAENIRSFFSRMICTSFTYLTHLQFLGLGLTEDGLGFLENVPKLTSLGLSGHRITDLGVGLRQIAKAKNLRHLDLSMVDEEPWLYHAPEESMSELLESLPSLTSLDISGTNLAGSKVKHPHGDQAKHPRDEKTISRSFGYKYFSFLGLCNCHELPFTWENVPAEQFTCFEILENLVLAVDVYKENSGMVLSVLYSLTSFVNKSMADRQLTKQKVDLDRKTPVLIEHLLRIIHLHPSVEVVQKDSCSCIALLLVRDSPSIKDIPTSLGQSLRARILETTISCLNNSSNQNTMRACLNILLKLKLPHDAKYCYSMKRYMKSVLDKFCNSEKTVFVSHTFETYAIHLMRIAIYYGDHESRDFLGQQRFIEFLLSIARRKITNCTHLAWQCLWGLTDEVPSNCMRFLAVPDALELYLECIKNKNHGDSFVRGLLGVMANVSEVSELRKELLQNEELIVIIRDLTDSQVMEEALSYQATCVMANLVSDGPEAWLLENLDRSSVLCKIATAVHRWDISDSMRTLYRSLLPFLEMAQKSHTPEAQLLAIWSICNLIKSKGNVYCQMLKMEGGLPIIEAIKNDPETTPEVLELAVMAMDLVSSKDIPDSDDTVKSALEIAASSS
ncbi:protein zer-1 homolog [Mizuhopecten yessoensis]|uniref:protein zer-1 homolog n=1 Tax=Mizuhopecten yessoensis TaxID=6573 RepID=UPI000B45F60B|nr:protein zer-1 homolog [Mizuhopecten yessoensis]